MTSPFHVQVRGLCPSCGCGYLGHMTAEELKNRAAGEEVNLSCPVCGLIHLTREEAEDRERKKISRTSRYRQLLHEALAGPGAESGTLPEQEE